MHKLWKTSVRLTPNPKKCRFFPKSPRIIQNFSLSTGLSKAEVLVDKWENQGNRTTVERVWITFSKAYPKFPPVEIFLKNLPRFPRKLPHSVASTPLFQTKLLILHTYQPLFPDFSTRFPQLVGNFVENLYIVYKSC